MKKRSFSVSIAGLVLGLAVAFSALSRSGWFPVIVIGLTLAVFYCVRQLLKSLQKARTSADGRGLALWRAFLSAVGVFLSVFVLVGVLFGQMNQRRWQNNTSFHMQRAMANSSMPDEPATEFTSNLPIVVLHGTGQYVSKETPTLVRAEFFDTRNRRASILAKPDYDGLASIHLRGYSTMNLPKQSYTLHTLDNQTNQTKVSLLGMPAEEDWVLYAPFEDKTMIRDVLAYQLTRTMGHYAPRTRYVELFVQSSLQSSSRKLSMRDYVGVYVLVEKIKRGQDRVNIAKLKPEHRTEPDITGGYIVKRDHNDRRGSRFRTSQGGPYFYVYPRPQDITQDQRTWLTRYFNSFESALYGPDFKDPKRGYAAYLDVDSFIDAHLLIELGKNVDGFRYSAFLSKDRGGKLKPEPPWDWNRSFGNANYYGGGHVRGWYSSHLRPTEISWYHRLQEDPTFMQRVAARWQVLRQDAFDPKKINAMIDSLASQLQEAQERNFRRWPILGHNMGCNYFVGDSHQEEVDWLKNWITDRIGWMDSHVASQMEF